MTIPPCKQGTGRGQDPSDERGGVIEWLDGDVAWTIIDQLATKYIGQPYPRGDERVVAVIEPERQTVGVA